MNDLISFVHFKDGRIVNSSNDGMELLGHFLLTQIGPKTDFFKIWLKDSRERAISSGPYFVYERDDLVYLEHLENGKIVPFATTKEQFLDIVTRWESLCKDDAYSVCGIGGYDLIIRRSLDGQRFNFETKV